MAPYEKNNPDLDLEIGLVSSEESCTSPATNKSTPRKKSWWRRIAVYKEEEEEEKPKGWLYYLSWIRNNLAMAPLSLAVVILAGRALATYKGHKHVQFEDGVQAWPDNMVLGDHNAMLATAAVMVFVSFFGDLLPFALDQVIMLIAFSFVTPYLWGHDVFRTRLFSTNPFVRSNLREWVCLMDGIVISFKVPYGTMCSDLVSSVFLVPVSVNDFGPASIYHILSVPEMPLF